MSNIIKKSATVVVAEAVTGSLKSILDGGFLHIFGGTIPATADAAKGSATLIRTLSLNGDGVTGLTFDSDGSNGVLKKPTAAVWESEASGGTTANSGTATFWRYCQDTTDDNSASSGKKRLQGEIGVDASSSWVVSTVSFGTGVQTVLNSSGFVIPQG